MDEMERRLIEVDQRGKSNTHRIDDLEKRADTLQELTTSVKLLAQNMDGMREEQKAQGERLAALERLPGERWNTMAKTILTTGAATLAGGLVGTIVTMMTR